MKFKIGDEVEVIDDLLYSITKEGSWGIVEKAMDGGYFRISFTFIPGRNMAIHRNTFVIDENHLMLHGSAASPYFRVINKIKQMDERRAQLGYRW